MVLPPCRVLDLSYIVVILALSNMEGTINKKALILTLLGLVLATMLAATPAMAQQTAKLTD